MDLKDVTLSEVSASAGQLLCDPTYTGSLEEPGSETEGTGVSTRAGGRGGDSVSKGDSFPSGR